jgi:RNA polymerase sigma-70 factor (ECF subfamily)
MLKFGMREWRLAYVVGLRVLRAADQAEDVAQDTLLRAYRARHTYDGRARPESWLWRIAFNTALSHARAFRRVPSADDLRTARSGGAMPGTQPTPEQEAASHEALRALDVCLRAMNAENRAALIATDVLGTTTHELGALLGTSSNAAKQRVFRARRVIRERMDQFAPQH